MVTRDVLKIFKLHSPTARAIFENFQNITRDHKSRNALAFLRFPIQIAWFLWGIWDKKRRLLFQNSSNIILFFILFSIT